ncbi:NADPH:quinone reductase-like Zn-dependent oxidoreductase [Variovorax boronicumulans]|uniref:NADPH:quinone reductase-like Zn-dependent oxidoreductase n=1 Tax=Variovorax boronicumulans TaxID=436515 RepID=A0AAW8D0S8_9BURK|nr:NADPH:quinone reductase-like Zn-dependent oxidoreductase [Variovorax boronicumulans]MDP9993322.1 NADPH:quinone reductase-like Zn-dependent oxidoreductase [Variovorax boronicumulans]MDQ0004811.1 NADPH:quinone reductase-like Zn-dependent oxidoreductase [Variovorax boronicumulans]MDQ0053596.1 NADPH:quinone reductase-like Zn-dependent oxidoreductase [Variovorax boronicumulans]
MKRIQYGMYGGPELMRLDEFELAAPGQGQVAVKVRFAAINPIDWKLRNGQMKIVTGKAFPRAMGFDFAGTVTAVGPGVTRFVPGDAVFGLARFKESGALGEAVIANETALALKPGNISFEDAACLGTPGVTAWNGLVDKARLTAGQHVFITAAPVRSAKRRSRLRECTALSSLALAARQPWRGHVPLACRTSSTTGPPTCRRCASVSTSSTTRPPR